VVQEEKPACQQVQQVNLSVAPDNTPAATISTSMGFTIADNDTDYFGKGKDRDIKRLGL